MDTRFITAFLMAVDTGSIAEAARRLNLTAAGVANAVYFGFSITDAMRTHPVRNPENMRLTH
jgi:hypothetical protein